MSSSSWVCFECRVAVRRPTQFEGEVACAECRAPCWPLGYRIPVPPKRDARAWCQLQEAQLLEFETKVDAEACARVRARHDLEREIRRLEAMPDCTGRAKAIRMLRSRLGDA